MATENKNMSKNEINTDINTENENALIPGYSSVEEFTKDGFKTLIEATRNSNSLPQDRDWDFYNTHQSFCDLMSSEGDNILRLINNVLKQQGVHGNIKSRDFEEKIELIIEANDIILERVANNLDELAGIRRNPEMPVEIQTVSAELPINGSWNKLNNAKISVATSSTASSQNILKSPNFVRLLTAQNIQRPQKFFKDKIDNSNSPWEPKIKDKPNNLKPLAIFLEQTDDGLGEIFCHPYEFELERIQPSPWQLAPLPSPIPPPRALANTPLHLVDTTDGLQRLLEVLRLQRQFALDLEHHSYRSYLGFTCLMQISTLEEDFLVDTLALRTELHVLNEVFTKSTVLKIFHGADNDVEWLQRDLGLYVVNMFDTHQAAKQLGYAGLSLAALLRRFCRVDADKRFQLADWRIRPLPEELKTYAREDTHYLIYIASMMRNELLEKGENVLRAVYTASTLVCRKRYSKPAVHTTSHLDLYRRCKKMFDNRQMFALKGLYHWRDTLAREEDESTGFILPNHMLLQIAELLPREMQGILACCNPIPPLVRSNLLELHRIVLRAREQSTIKPILSEEARSRGSTQQHSNKINIDTALNCPHDLPRGEDFRDDLPTLLGSLLQEKPLWEVVKPSEKLEISKAKLTVFDTEEKVEKKSRVSSKMQRLKFLGPYERYKLVKKYAQAEETKEAKESEKDEGRTDNERIEALHEHFKTLATTTTQFPPSTNQKEPEEPPPPERLNPTSLGQPVAKKRKREPSPVNNTEELYPEATPVKQQHTTPNQPGKKKRIRNRNKQNMQSLNEHLHNERRGNKQQECTPQKQQSNFKKQHNQQQRQNNQKEQQQQHKPRHLNNPQHQQFNKSPNKHINNPSPRDGKRKWNNNQNEGSNPKRKRESSDNAGGENFKPFDYSAVDFRQFQGGAGSAQQTKKMATNFRGKGSKNKKADNIGRANTRSSTFRGGRGRGRGGGNRGGW